MKNNTYIKKERDRKIDIFLITVLGWLQMLDFFFTWFGIANDMIVEGNIFMIKLFEIPFIPSIILRMIMVICIGVLMVVVREHSRTTFVAITIFGIFMNLWIMQLHGVWIVASNVLTM